MCIAICVYDNRMHGKGIDGICFVGVTEYGDNRNVKNQC